MHPKAARVTWDPEAFWLRITPNRLGEPGISCHGVRIIACVSAFQRCLCFARLHPKLSYSKARWHPALAASLPADCVPGPARRSQRSAPALLLLL